MTMIDIYRQIIVVAFHEAKGVSAAQGYLLDNYMMLMLGILNDLRTGTHARLWKLLKVHLSLPVFDIADIFNFSCNDIQNFSHMSFS